MAMATTITIIVTGITDIMNIGRHPMHLIIMEVI